MSTTFLTELITSITPPLAQIFYRYGFGKGLAGLYLSSDLLTYLTNVFTDYILPFLGVSPQYAVKGKMSLEETALS